VGEDDPQLHHRERRSEAASPAAAEREPRGAVEAVGEALRVEGLRGVVVAVVEVD